MKSDYIVRARKFLKQVYPYLKGDFNNVEKILIDIYKFNINNKRKVIVQSGSARCVLITSDYVIKWDYNKNGVECWGGCAEEITNYNEAVRDNYDYLFAKITRIRVCGKYFYVMPRINNVGKEYGNFTDDEIQYLRDKGYSDIHEMNYGSYKNKRILIDYACRCY